MRSASSPRAVSMITGRSPRERIQRQSERPSVPGSMTSSTTSSGSRGCDQRSRRVAVAGLERVEAVAPEVADDDVANDRLVVDDENSGHRSHCHSRWSCLLVDPLAVVLAAPSRGGRRRASCRAANAASSGGSGRGRDGRSAARSRCTSGRRAGRSCSSRRKRVLRSPCQSRTARDREQQRERCRQRSVQLLARVEAALRTRDAPQPEAVVVVEAVELADRLAQPTPVAEDDDQRDRDHPREAGVEVHVLDERPAPDELARATGDRARGRSRAARRSAAAWTQCSARSVREKRWMYRGALVKCAGSGSVGLEAIRAADQRIDVVAALLPVARVDVIGDDDPLDPFDVLVAVHLRDHDTHRCAVLAGSGLPSIS